MAVVDPGVGGNRKGLIVRTKTGKLLVGPNNGLLSIVFQREGVEQAVAIDEHSSLTLASKAHSSTFHGQTVFAPVSAHLSKGVKITEFGNLLQESELQKITIDSEPGNSWLVGYLVNIDSFGQLRTTIANHKVRDVKNLNIRLSIRNREALYEGPSRISRIFEGTPQNLPLIVPSSTGCLDIAVNLGSASERLGIRHDKIALDANLRPITTISMEWASAGDV